MEYLNGILTVNGISVALSSKEQEGMESYASLIFMAACARGASCEKRDES